MYNKYVRSTCDSNLRLNSVVLVYYNLYILFDTTNNSIYGVNSLVSLTERILTFGKTNELSKYH